MLTESRIRQLLSPFDLRLSGAQTGQVITYLELLLRWNRKINLTAVRSEEESVTRHFGESLYLARWAELKGRLLDIGSGAGFPGLALKIAFPELQVTLLEPVAKKRVFLKEAARSCEMNGVEARGERLDDFAAGSSRKGYDSATARAVGDLKRLVPQAVECLAPKGRLYLWITRRQAETELTVNKSLVVWQEPIRVPLTRAGLICIGAVQADSQARPV